jgi:tetratricopeptide (TPR) repeat protein
MSAATTLLPPTVTKDPRFQAGRKLVERGMADQGAVDIFATLLEESTQKYGDSSIETAPAYYEYGNALLRAAALQQQQDEEENNMDDGGLDGKDDADSHRRIAAATAAEKRQQQQTEEEDDCKPAALPEKGEDADESSAERDEVSNQNPDDDVELALTMMENAYSILDDYNETFQNGASRSEANPASEPAATADYTEWVKDQLPRVLLGIGDTLSTLGRHADAADAYSRSLQLRQDILEGFSSEDETLDQLVAHRKVVEATVLIAEELLACPPDQDVVTSETSTLIVEKEERIAYAKGYYDKARDALQEAVFFMGKLAARNVDLGREKEDVCFLATLVMGVGESLAAIDEEMAAAAGSESTEPVKKKAKR